MLKKSYYKRRGFFKKPHTHTQMPCQHDEIDMNSPSIYTSALVHTVCRVEPALFGQFLGVETVASKQTADGWLYNLRSGTPRPFEELERGVQSLDAHLQRCGGTSASQFRTVAGDTDKILLGAAQIDDGEVWRTNSVLPPRKREVIGDPAALANPAGLERLCKQLQVDFAVSVHGSEGTKRRREPVQSIYKELADSEERKTKRAAPTKRPTNTEVLLEAKEETVRALRAALAAKDETLRAHLDTIRTQEALIVALQTL